MKKTILTPLFAVAIGLSLTAASAHGPAEGKPGVIQPGFAGAIPNIPGKSFKTVTVTYPPGGTTPAHRHAKSAFIYATVLEGSIRSQVEGGEVKTYKVGEFWTENPGDHHVVSENASKTKPAKLLAVFVVDTDDTELVTIDAK